MLKCHLSNNLRQPSAIVECFVIHHLDGWMDFDMSHILLNEHASLPGTNHARSLSISSMLRFL